MSKVYYTENYKIYSMFGWTFVHVRRFEKHKPDYGKRVLYLPYEDETLTDEDIKTYITFA